MPTAVRIRREEEPRITVSSKDAENGPELSKIYQGRALKWYAFYIVYVPRNLSGVSGANNQIICNHFLQTKY